MKTPASQRIAPYLADLRDRKITGRQVARELGVTESWLSRVIRAAGIIHEKKPSRAEKKALRAARLAFRLNAARTMSVSDAAKACKVHPRTITRLLASKKGSNGKP